MRILICKRAFTIGDPRSLPPHPCASIPWPLIHTCTSEIPANYNRPCLTCATVWFINHRLATGRSRIFSHRRSAVIFSVGIHVVIFMSKCAASHYPQPSLANPRRSTTPSRTSNADRRWASRLMRSANGSMEMRNDRLVRDGQWLLSLSANLCKLTVPKMRVRPSARPLSTSVCPFDRVGGPTERWNGRGKSETRWPARNFRAGDFNRDSAFLLRTSHVAVALIGANAKTIGIDGGARRRLVGAALVNVGASV